MTQWGCRPRPDRPDLGGRPAPPRVKRSIHSRGARGEQPDRHRPRCRRRHPDEVEDDEGAAPPVRAQHDRARPGGRAGGRARADRRRRGPPARAGRGPHPRARARRGARGPGDPGRAPATPSGWPWSRPARPSGTVIVAAGDTPLLEGESLRAFAEEHEAAQRAVSILSGVVANPFGYGRIVRNDEGDVEAIVEEKDATREQREIREINSRDPRLRRGVPGRGAAEALQRQRQGRVLPDRHRADRPRRRPHRGRPRRSTTSCRPRAPTTGSSSPHSAAS